MTSRLAVNIPQSTLAVVVDSTAGRVQPKPEAARAIVPAEHASETYQNGNISTAFFQDGIVLPVGARVAVLQPLTTGRCFFT